MRPESYEASAFTLGLELALTSTARRSVAFLACSRSGKTWAVFRPVGSGRRRLDPDVRRLLGSPSRSKHALRLAHAHHDA